MAKKYSNEQVDRAKNIDLEQFLSRRGETLKRAGSEYKWIYRDSSGTHDSVTVKGNKWFDHKRQQGGDPIGFLQEFMGLSFKESVEELLGGEQGNELFVKNNSAAQTPQLKREFALPDKAENMRKLYAYLTKTRFINPDVVTHFVKAKALFQENKHDNIVFLGLDENGVARAGQKKSTKDTFIVTKTGSYPMKTIMRLFFKWGIALDRNYTLPEPIVREISYADKEKVEAAIIKKYPSKSEQNCTTNQPATPQPQTSQTPTVPKADGNKKLKAVGGAIKEKMDKEDANV